jgi:hypothetical protein
VSSITSVYLLRKRKPEDPWPQENPIRETIYYGSTSGPLELTPERYDEYKAMADRGVVQHKALYDVEFLYHVVAPPTPKHERKRLSKMFPSLGRATSSGCPLLLS